MIWRRSLQEGFRKHPLLLGGDYVRALERRFPIKHFMGKAQLGRRVPNNCLIGMEVRGWKYYLLP
jgi:hypothetical protein